MSSRSKQLLWFGAGVVVGCTAAFTAAFADEIVMMIVRRPAPAEEIVQRAEAAPDGAEPAEHPAPQEVLR